MSVPHYYYRKMEFQLDQHDATCLFRVVAGNEMLCPTKIQVAGGWRIGLTVKIQIMKIYIGCH